MIREGSDITLVGWGAQLSVMEQACIDAEKVSGFTAKVFHSWNFNHSKLHQASLFRIFRNIGYELFCTFLVTSIDIFLIEPRI